MAIREISLPDIGEGVTEGELVKWLVNAGDSVEEDQPLAEVMTDKATVEVPSPISGKVVEIKANEGDMLPIGTLMLTLEEGASGSVSATPPPPPPVAKPTSTPPKVATPASAPPPTINVNGFAVSPPVADNTVLATPGTRRLAREMAVDINSIVGTGNVGRVTREDVLGTVGGEPVSAKTSVSIPAGTLEEREPMRGIRKKIAENMQLFKKIIPHFTLMDEANVTALVALRTELKEVGKKLDVKITYLPFVMKALVATLRDFPMVNASIDDEAGEIVYKKYYNVGFAAETPNGLLVPVIKNVESKTILQISREIIELATRAREGKLALDEMRGSTITITNIGSIAGNYATPIINHPEVAILGMYKISEKPVIKNGELSSIQAMNFTVTADHRLIDGAVAARFLKDFIERIESPGKLMLDMV